MLVFTGNFWENERYILLLPQRWHTNAIVAKINYTFTSADHGYAALARLKAGFI